MGLKDGYACISGLEDISERPHMSMKRFFAKNEQKRSGMRMCGALRERRWRRAMRALIKKQKKQRGKRPQMPCLHEHLRTLNIIVSCAHNHNHDRQEPEKEGGYYGSQ